MRVNTKQAVRLFFQNPSLEQVFKEAIANALDANATNIVVDIYIDSFEKQETLPPPQHFQAVKEPQPPKRPTVKPDALPPTQKIERDAGGMKLLRILLTTGIDHRLPVDERDAFTIEDASVFCFVEISAAEADDRSITIRFTHSTGLAQSYTLPVSQSPAWRTWSKLNLTKSMTGTWLCEVFNEDNVLLASRPFVVVDE